jgi:hypothetical protein
MHTRIKKVKVVKELSEKNLVRQVLDSPIQTTKNLLEYVYLHLIRRYIIPSRKKDTY